MSARTAEKARPEATPPRDRAGDPAAHPLDDWLRRELRALCPPAAEEALPSGIAALAARLEKRLARAGSHPADETPHETADETGAWPRPADRRKQRRPAG